MSKRKPVKPAPVKQAPLKKAAAPRPSSTPAPRSSNIRAGWWVGLLAAALGFLLYANTLKHDYCLDDFSSIKENRVVKSGLNRESLELIFTKEYRYGAWSSPGSLYRPIPLAVFAWQWQEWPDNPMPGHLMNILLYALTGLLLWFTWRRILTNYPPVLTALAVLIFMAHPVHTEVVANIKSVDEILALLFSTLALNFIWRALDGDKWAWLLPAVVSYGLALFCKESSITFLAIFPLTIWFFSNHSLSKNALVSGLMLAPAAYFLKTYFDVIGAQEHKETYSVLDNFIVGAADASSRLASAFMMCWRYLWVLIMPHPLVHDMGFPQMKAVAFTEWRSLLGLLTYLGMGVWALLNLKKKHFLSFAILFYLATFSIISNVQIQIGELKIGTIIGTSYGERLLYAPSLGFAFALAYLLCKIFNINDLTRIWNPNGKGAALWSVAGILLALYAVKTIARNPVWKNSGTLYAADIKTSPNCAKLNYHNALELTKQGMDENSERVKDPAWIQKGIDAYSKAIQLYPEYHDAFGGRGLAYFRLQKYDQAFEDYQKSLKYRPGDSKVLSNMGYIYFIRGQMDKAEEVYRQSIQSDAFFVDARRNLGAILAMKKNYPAAIEQWEAALKFAPEAENVTLLLYIGQSYRDMGKPVEASNYLKRVLQYEPKNIAAILYMGLASKDLGQAETALKYWDEALQLDLNGVNPVLLQIVGQGCQELGRPDKAQLFLEKAMQLNGGMRQQ